MPTLSNLTPEQFEICEILWSMDTMEEIVEWIKLQPADRFVEAWSMLHMIIAATIDDLDLGEMTEAKEAIQKIRERR
jgi:hypothetical protein